MSSMKNSEENGQDPIYLVASDDDNDKAPAKRVPALAFGLYKVPNDQHGEQIVVDAIKAGYRHFDSASVYGNEVTVGRALQRCLSIDDAEPSPSSSYSKYPRVRRENLYIASKVWNDAQISGRDAVRQSVLQSLKDLQLEYLDICYVHWPVPNHYVETYEELQLLLREGRIRAIGISNFTIDEYKTLLSDPSITIKPQIHQMEISPFMYRPTTIDYFQTNHGMLVAASKALHRATHITVVEPSGDDSNQQMSVSSPHKGSMIVEQIADTHHVSSAQVMLRWSYQKGFVVLAKTSNTERMVENRNILNFVLSDNEMKILDGLTTEDEIQERSDLESKRKLGL